VSDAELIQELDGELSQAARTELGARLSNSAEVAARLELLRRRTARFSELLGTIDPAEARVQASRRNARVEVVRQARSPRLSRYRPLLQVAAAIALLLGVLFIVPPVRAWMIDRVRDLAGALGFESPATSRESPVVPQAAPREADVTITFALESDTLDVFAAQRAGRIILRRTTASSATAEAAGVSGTELVFLPGRLRIEGPSSPDAEYILTLPPRAAAIRLHRPDGTSVMHPVPAHGTENRIDLAQ
jgi:anti-sigma factor RsiW